MKYEIETVLAGARVTRMEQRDLTKELLEGLLKQEAANVQLAADKRSELANELRRLARTVYNGEAPFDKPLTYDDGPEITARVRGVWKGLPSKGENRRLERDIKDARTRLAAAEQERESPLESYLRAAQAAGETHVSTNALKDAGVSPTETMDIVSKGHQARFGSNA